MKTLHSINTSTKTLTARQAAAIFMHTNNEAKAYRFIIACTDGNVRLNGYICRIDHTDDGPIPPLNPEILRKIKYEL